MENPERGPHQTTCSLGRKKPAAQDVPGLGLIAGSGNFPFLVAKEARRQGIAPVVAIGFKSQTDPALAGHVDQMHYVGVGQLGRLIDIFKKAGVRRAVMAGKLQHRLIFTDLKFDLRMVALVARLKDRRADTILGAIAQEMAKDGVVLIDSTVYLTQDLAREGAMTRARPGRAQQEDIEFGSRIAWELARLDIGQTVAVKDKAVVAVEGIEGTDEMILRAGKLAGQGVTIVKVFKPRQDMRFDVPVVGAQTLDVMAQAGASVLALAAGKTLILDREQFLTQADARGIAVVGIVPQGAGDVPERGGGNG